MDTKDVLLWANVAEMWSVVAEVEGMKAINLERERGGYALAYSEESFIDAAKILKAISLNIHNLRG